MAEILIENVSKSYVSKDGSVQALKNVNLAIESGDISESSECPEQEKVPWSVV